MSRALPHSFVTRLSPLATLGSSRCQTPHSEPITPYISSIPMQAAELARFVRQIEIKTRGLSSQVFSGEYQAAFRGRGMSFSEVRGYQPGDDVRDIDWNVTARTGEPHIKIFEEERELTVLLAVDTSRSMGFGTHVHSKQRLAIELAAVLGSAALNNNDKVGAVLYGHTATPVFVPPAKGFQHVLRIVRELAQAPETSPDPSAASAQTQELAAALRFLDRLTRRRAIVFLISDFIDAADYRTPLRVVAQRHDLVGLHLHDRFEQKLPRVGLLPVVDLETGLRRLVDTSDPQTQYRHTHYYAKLSQQVEAEFRSAGAQLLHLHTGEDYVRRLLAFFMRRHNLRR